MAGQVPTKPNYQGNSVRHTHICVLIVREAIISLLKKARSTATYTTKRRSAVDERTTRHTGYEISQRKRKRAEQSFGWMKMVGMLKKVKLRGIDKVGWLFTFTGAAYNLCRLRNLMART